MILRSSHRKKFLRLSDCVLEGSNRIRKLQRLSSSFFLGGPRWNYAHSYHLANRNLKVKVMLSLDNFAVVFCFCFAFLFVVLLVTVVSACMFGTPWDTNGVTLVLAVTSYGAALVLVKRRAKLTSAGIFIT